MKSLGQSIQYSDDQLAEILSPAHFVGTRHTAGGPAPAETARALAASRDILQRDERQAAGLRDAIAAAESRLAARSRAL